MVPATLVIGLGNPLRGDDGIGPRVIEALRERELPPGCRAIDGGTAGLGLLNLMEGWERVVIVDAADVGRAAGEFVRFTPAEAQLTTTTGRPSLHHFGLGETLALAEALGRPLLPIVIYGVQPARIDWGEGLDPAVEAALPALVDAVMAELETGC